MLGHGVWGRWGITRLTLRCAFEDDGSVELSATVDAAGFSGAGSAWFTTEAVEGFCARLADYPLAPDRLPIIAGGNWDDDGQGLKERHLAIRISPQGGAGALRVQVELAQQGLERAVSTWFLVGYNDLDKLRIGLREVLEQKAGSAKLTSTL